MFLITHKHYRCNTFVPIIKRNNSQLLNIDNKPMLFYTSSCWGHVGDIKPSESHSKHETNIFNLQPLSPGLCFNYWQEKYRVEEERDKHYQMAWKWFSRLCKQWTYLHSFRKRKYDCCISHNYTSKLSSMKSFSNCNGLHCLHDS